MEKSIKKFIAFLMVVVLSFSVVSYVGNTDFTAKAASSTAISINKAPTLKSSSVKATSVKLSWSKTSGATSYKIYRSTDKKNWKCIKTTESTSYTVKKLTTETKYYFKIRAYKNSTKSPYSNIVAVTPKLTQVKSFKVKFNSNEKVTVSWAKVSGATAYQVLYSTSSDFKSGNKKITVDSDKLKCTIKNLNKNKKYYVKVRAIRKADGKTYKGSYTEKLQLVMKSKIYYRYITQTVYATDNVNIRKGPGTSYSSVGVLKKGKSIKKIAAGSNKWTKVSYNGGTYYISSSYLTTTKPVVTTTTEPTTTKPTTTKPKEEPTTRYYYREDGQKMHVDENGIARPVYEDVSQAAPDTVTRPSHCPDCGKPSKECARSTSSYYCKDCKRTIKAGECHIRSHFEKYV